MSTESRSDLLRLLRLFSCNNKMVATAHFDRFACFFIVYRTILKFPTTVVDLYSHSYSSVIFVLIILKYKGLGIQYSGWVVCGFPCTILSFFSHYFVTCIPTLIHMPHCSMSRCWCCLSFAITKGSDCSVLGLKFCRH